MNGPLAGVRVLDIGISIQGPFAGTILGMLGADVVKIERSGDRVMQERPTQRGLSTTYTIANLAKRIAWLDLKDSATKAVREKLIKQADVILDNMRPGAVDRIGLGFDDARAVNPRIVSASSPGWGDSGPMRDWAAIDSHVQAFSGFAGDSGPEGAPPEFVRYPHLDISGATYYAAALIVALIAAERTGQAQRLTASHLGAAISLQTTRLAEHFATGLPVLPAGSASVRCAPDRYFRAQDLVWFAVSVLSQRHWEDFCEAVERPDLLDDERYATNGLRVANREFLDADLERIFAGKPARWWAYRLQQAYVPFSYLLDFETLRYHKHVIDAGLMTTAHHPVNGEMHIGALPWNYSRTPVELGFHQPVSGSATDEIKKSGFGPARKKRPAKPDLAPDSPPLAGYRVIDASRGITGPFAALLLAEAGAEVIKVELPGGDYTRDFEPAGAIFEALNRNKTGRVIDFESMEGHEELLDLIATADVFIEDWGPGVGELNGFGEDWLDQINPRLVYCRITPVGEDGPLLGAATSELVLQAMSEFWKTVGRPGEPPCRVATDICTTGAGVIAAIGILAALYERLGNGDGQRVSVNQLGAAMFLRSFQWAAYTAPDVWEGNTFSNSYVMGPKYGYRTKDRPIYTMLNNGTEEQFIRILTELDMLHLLEDSRFFEDGGRHVIGLGKYAQEYKDVWEQAFATRTAAEITALFNANGGSCVEQRFPHDIAGHPQVQALGIIEAGPDGRRHVRAPWTGSWKRPDLRPAPALQPLAEESAAMER